MYGTLKNKENIKNRKLKLEHVTDILNNHAIIHFPRKIEYCH